MSVQQMSLLLLTPYYHPVPNFIAKDIADRMSLHGRITVITAHPNYPLGRFYGGTRWWRPERTVENGVVVWRLPMIPDQSKSVGRRTVSYLSFLFVAMIWAPLVVRRPSVVWVYQTPFTTAIAALWFKLLFRSRLVYTCADLWPESFTAAGVARPGLFMRALFGLRRLTNTWADVIICSTLGTQDRFASEGVPAERLLYVPVWVQGTDTPVPWRKERHRSIVYAGNLGPAQQLDTVIRAAAELQREGLDITFDLYGTGSCEEELRALAQELEVRNVRFHGRVSPEVAFAASAGALGQIVALRPAPLFRMTVPSKLAFCFAAAAPVIYGLEGEPAELAAASGGALAFTAGHPEALASAVRELVGKTVEERETMRVSLRQYYEEHFAREKLLGVYEEVLTRAADPRAAYPVDRERSA
jgi:colanic acid biosynthesis glycosyl transferase WcaI